MKKKLSVYLKFFISNIIIFSMMLQSFATLSSSDGSAFVTKKEYIFMDEKNTSFRIRRWNTVSMTYVTPAGYGEVGAFSYVDFTVDSVLVYKK